MDTLIKSCFASLLVLVFSISAYALDKDSIIGYWPADEGSGDKAADVYGGLDGSLQEGPGWTGKPHKAGWGEGKFGKGLAFDEKKDWFVFVGTNDTLDTKTGKPKTSFTVAYWIKSKKAAGKGRTVEKGSSGWTQGWHCALVNGRAFSEGCDNVAPGWQLSGNKTVADDTWHHLTHVFDLADKKEARIYVDGALDGSKDISSDPDIAGMGWPLNFGTAGKVVNPWHEFLDGAMDEIAIFSKSLNEGEIKELTRGAIGPKAVEKTNKLLTTWGDIKGRY